MDKNQIKQRLEKERERIQQLLEEDEKEAVSQERDAEELSSVDQHVADHGTETFEQEKALSILETHKEELADIESAFQRLENDDYGKCEACGKPIPEERLEARPAARFCVDHQRQAEAELRI